MDNHSTIDVPRLVLLIADDGALKLEMSPSTADQLMQKGEILAELDIKYVKDFDSNIAKSSGTKKGKS